MAPPARSRAERGPLGALALGLSLLAAGAGCEPSSPERTVPASDPALRDRNGVLELRGAPFSGWVTEGGAEAPLVGRTPYLHGLRHGRATARYQNGALAYEKLFRHGLREGVHRGFWPDGKPQFVYRYEKDLFAGEQVAYYRNGARAELRHYRDGREEGQQTQWDGEGRVQANYVFRDGKRYGIVGRFDCVTVHED